MENCIKRLKENLGKLKRNEEQMDAQQKERYKAQLCKLRKQIARDAGKLGAAYVTIGCHFLESGGESEREACRERITRILDCADAKATVRKSLDSLFADYDIAAFLIALSPIQRRVFYEAYSPYWLKHCKQTGDPDFPYANDIIGMEWWEDGKQWVKAGGRDGIRDALPPTKEMVDDYRRMEDA